MATTERVWLGVWKILLLGDHLNDMALQDASEELLELINSANGMCCSSGRGWLKVVIYCQITIGSLILVSIVTD